MIAARSTYRHVPTFHATRKRVTAWLATAVGKSNPTTRAAVAAIKIRGRARICRITLLRCQFMLNFLAMFVAVILNKDTSRRY